MNEMTPEETLTALGLELPPTPKPGGGIGVRSAVGMGSLPNNVAVEVEAIFEIAE